MAIGRRKRRDLANKLDSALTSLEEDSGGTDVNGEHVLTFTEDQLMAIITELQEVLRELDIEQELIK